MLSGFHLIFKEVYWCVKIKVQTLTFSFRSIVTERLYKHLIKGDCDRSVSLVGYHFFGFWLIAPVCMCCFSHKQSAVWIFLKCVVAFQSCQTVFEHDRWKKRKYILKNCKKITDKIFSKALNFNCIIWFLGKKIFCKKLRHLFNYKNKSSSQMAILTRIYFCRETHLRESPFIISALKW